MMALFSEFMPKFAEVFGTVSVLLGVAILILFLVLHKIGGQSERSLNQQEEKKQKL